MKGRADNMARWALFQRGIKVGEHRRMPMAELRAVLDRMPSISDTKSYIASGNLVFSAAGDAASLAKDARGLLWFCR